MDKATPMHFMLLLVSLVAFGWGGMLYHAIRASAGFLFIARRNPSMYWTDNWVLKRKPFFTRRQRILNGIAALVVPVLSTGFGLVVIYWILSLLAMLV